MINAVSTLLLEWDGYDTWLVITAALAAMACALPGNYLLLRRQSLLGDALSHAVLPGIVAGYLAWGMLESTGRLSISQLANWRHLALFTGAALSGLLCVLATELTQRWGRIDAGSALGVVFTSFFALGLLLIRMAADTAHIDPSCVLYGNLELVLLDNIPGTPIPRAAAVNAIAVAMNLGLWLLLYKELQLTAFDPGFAETTGIPASKLNYGVAMATAMTVVATFETVGSILVIAMLIVPVATARLLTDRLPTMLAVSVAIAAGSACLGAVAAVILPQPIFSAFGFEEIQDVGAAGMIGLTSGMLFLIALIAGPKYGLLRQAWNQFWWQIQVAADDLLGVLFRQEETAQDISSSATSPDPGLISHPRWVQRFARQRLATRGLIASETGHDVLTDAGRQRARELVRSHRLWEAFLSQRYQVPEQRVHTSAEKVEHYLGESLRSQLAEELHQSAADPHGRTIPPES